MQQRIEIPLDTRFSANSHLTEDILWEPPNNRFISGVTSGTVTLHLPSVPPTHPVPLMVICPGGGYSGVSIDKEGHFVAQWLAERGIAGAVVKYRIPTPGSDTPLPLPFLDVLNAMKLVSEHASQWGIDMERIGFMGFSAGGHLAGNIALRYSEMARQSLIAPEGIRPAAIVLLYSVVSFFPQHGPCRSVANLLGEGAPEQDLELYSIHKHITSSAPPVFLAHSDDDPCVPVAHSGLVVDVCREQGVPCVFHRVPTGGHGYGMGISGEDSGSWVPKFEMWLQERKFIV